MAPRVFTIPPGAAFLDTLVGALLAGELAPGIDPADPFSLADVTVYLPTRRAGRAIRDVFLARAGRPLLLPRIRTLGDLDEDEAALDGLDHADLPPAVSPVERQLVLTRLVLGWSAALVRAAANLPEEDPIVPASPADAAHMAASLARLIDQVGPEPEAWAGLFSGVPADLARYWEITLKFLEIATAAWPAYLAEHGLIDYGARRDRLIRAEAARLAARGSTAPVIAAGSTGSVPATAELLAAIARLPNGAVVLPGLDQELDPESWAEVGPSEREPAGAGHPQYGLKRLIESLGIRREDVMRLGTLSRAAGWRARLVSEAMRPAATTELWSASPALRPEQKTAALADVAIVDAGNEREEALAVAAILRGVAEGPDQVAALVTPDRGLARRVAVELQRWGIVVDDSAGRPLRLTPPGVLARLVAEAALNGCAADTILALLKHPLASFGMEPSLVRRSARALERAVLRGAQLRPGLEPIRRVLQSAAAARRQEGRRGAPSRAARGLHDADWDGAAALLDRLEAALAPLEALAGSRHRALTELVAAHEAAVRAVLQPASGAPSGEATEALANAFVELGAGAKAGPDIRPGDYPGLFAVLTGRAVVRPRGGFDPRIHIWGALEARLQSVDLVVLGGLNEGTWPGQTRLDPLLSRPMRAALALEPPERRIGLAAHDFAQALSHPKVWLTRANRENGEPRVASRWLQRLVAYAGPDHTAAMRGRGAALLQAAGILDRAADRAPAPRPRPSPPPALRPRKLSVTEIETLIRDPYATYARHVLKLRPFEPLAKLPDAQERGTLVHAILERFVAERPAGPFDDAAVERLCAIGREAFSAYADFPEITALWWPRFERIARWFVKAEADRSDVVGRILEASGRWQVSPEFELSARADRIDRLADGTLGIVDYKTGTPPSVDEVLSLAPQLPIEALMARAGCFDGVAAAEVSRLEYYHISGRGEGGKVCPRGFRDTPRSGKPAMELPEALAVTEGRVQGLVAHFARPEAVYLSRKIPRRGRDFAGDYDHLARVAEWTGGDDAEAEAAEP